MFKVDNLSGHPEMLLHWRVTLGALQVIGPEGVEALLGLGSTWAMDGSGIRPVIGTASTEQSPDIGVRLELQRSAFVGMPPQ